MAEEALLKHCRERLQGLEQDRNGWFTHWREIADYILPRRYRWLMTPNEAKGRGPWMNNRIIDSTGTIALRTLASGMMSGITSPSRPWFKLRMQGDDDDQSNPITVWLAECEKRMLTVFAESNFYPAMAQLYLDLGAFGSGCVLIYEDFHDVIRCYNPCAGEYYYGVSSKGRVDTVGRKFTMNLGQMVEEFGKDALADTTRQLLDNANPGFALSQEFQIGHLLEPNLEPRGSVSKRFAFREVYWEFGKNESSFKVLRARGFNEFPGMTPRWEVTGNDAYGSSPAMDALGDIKQLQQETKRKAQAIDKMANPPLLADVQLKNQPASTLPGGITFVNNLGSDRPGMVPVYKNDRPPIAELMQDITEIQKRIQRVFFNDLFMMFQNLDAEPRSAAAVDARREEKLVMLGPVLERFLNEALDPAIDRVFGIMYRGGLFPPAPDQIKGTFVKTEYVSTLASAQKASATTAIERMFATAGNLVAVDPTVMDVIDTREAMQEYGTLLGVPPKLIRSDIAVEAIQKERAKQQQQAQALEATQALAASAKNLSQTDVGGGSNALQAMTGGTLQ